MPLPIYAMPSNVCRLNILYHFFIVYFSFCFLYLHLLDTIRLILVSIYRCSCWRSAQSYFVYSLITLSNISVIHTFISSPIHCFLVSPGYFNYIVLSWARYATCNIACVIFLFLLKFLTNVHSLRL